MCASVSLRWSASLIDQQPLNSPLIVSSASPAALTDSLDFTRSPILTCKHSAQPSFNYNNNSNSNNKLLLENLSIIVMKDQLLCHSTSKKKPLMHSANLVFCYMRMILKLRLVINNIVSYRGNLLLTRVSNGQQCSPLLQSDWTFKAPLIFLNCRDNRAKFMG